MYEKHNLVHHSNPQIHPYTTLFRSQTMTITGKSDTQTLENVLVGDVWVLGGQSNMEFPITKVDDGELEVVSANFPQIRLLTDRKCTRLNSSHTNITDPVFCSQYTIR